MSYKKREGSNNQVNASSSSSSRRIIRAPVLPIIRKPWRKGNIQGVMSCSNNSLGYKVSRFANKVSYPTLLLNRVPSIRRIDLVGKGKDKFMGSPERGIGLADIMRRTSRVKSRYSNQLIWDIMHYKTLMCVMIGFSIWWYNVPDQILNVPFVLTKPELGGLIDMIKDTFINGVCIEHKNPSPCECGELKNSVTKSVFGQDMSDCEIRKARAMSLATMLTGAIVVILLARDSIPSEGVDIDIFK